VYCLASEKPLRLVYETFYLAIGYNFYDIIKLDEYDFISIYENN